MRRVLSMILLAAAIPAAAENWERYAQTADASLYYDKERMVLMSGTAFIWDLHDLRDEVSGTEGKSYRSVLHAVEVNCRKEQLRVLSFHRMTGAMGAGALANENLLVGAWKTPPDNSAESRLMALACEQ